jgi:hypothetical protein
MPCLAMAIALTTSGMEWTSFAPKPSLSTVGMYSPAPEISWPGRKSANSYSSTDGGPYKLGMNKMTCGRDSYIRDLTPMLEAVYFRKTKLLIGSVGGDGSTKHVQEMLEIVTEITKSRGFQFKIATINAGISRDLIKERIDDNRVTPCGPVEPLTRNAVDQAVDVVAQMGAEPLDAPIP